MKTTRWRAGRGLVAGVMAAGWMCGCGVLGWAQCKATAKGQASPADSAPTVVLAGRHPVLPLVRVKGYPFVEGSVNGVRGKLLFDLGDPNTFTLNYHHVPLPGGVVVGSGVFGSGQHFNVMCWPVVDTVEVGADLRYKGVTQVRGNDGLQIEQHITPDYLGWIGVKFFRDRYVLKLDLRRPEAAFFRDDAGGKGVREALRKESVMERLPFHLNAEGNLPSMEATVGSVRLPLVFDTGSSEVLWADAATEAQMEKDGVLREGEDGGYTLGPIAVDGVTLPAVEHVRVETHACPFGREVGADGGPVVGLGFNFLTRYRSVWDYQRRVLYLLRG